MLVEGHSDWWDRALSPAPHSVNHLGTRPDQEWLVEKHTVAFQTLVLAWENGLAEQGRGGSVEEVELKLKGVELKLQGVEHWDNMLEFDGEVGQKPQ